MSERGESMAEIGGGWKEVVMLPVGGNGCEWLFHAFNGVEYEVSLL